MVTWMFVVAEELELALVPVTATMNTGTAMGQVTDNTRPVNEPPQPGGKVNPGLIARVTVPEKPLIGATAMVEFPVTVTIVVIGGPAIVKSTCETETLVLLDKTFGGLPEVAFTGTVNGPTLAGQFTDKTAPLKEPVHPDGKTKPGPVVHATLPENPLIALNVHVEAPGKVVIGGHDGAKSTTWKVTEFEVTLCVPAAPVTLAR